MFTHVQLFHDVARIYKCQMFVKYTSRGNAAFLRAIQPSLNGSAIVNAI